VRVARFETSTVLPPLMVATRGLCSTWTVWKLWLILEGSVESDTVASRV